MTSLFSSNQVDEAFSACSTAIIRSSHVKLGSRHSFLSIFSLLLLTRFLAISPPEIFLRPLPLLDLEFADRSRRWRTQKTTLLLLLEGGTASAKHRESAMRIPSLPATMKRTTRTRRISTRVREACLFSLLLDLLKLICHHSLTFIRPLSSLLSMSDSPLFARILHPFRNARKETQSDLQSPSTRT